MAELVRLSWPIAVSTLSYSVMTLVDTLFVARLGKAPLAGVGLGGVAAFTLLCFSIGLLRGVKVLVSQAVGAGRRDEAGSYLAAGLAMAVGLGVLTLGLGLVVAPLLAVVASTAEVGAAASSYLSIRMLGAPFMLVYVALREARYGQGDARTPMYASVAANAVNIAADYVLIVVLGHGVEGAAWASVAAIGVEMAILLLAQHAAGWTRPASVDRYVRAVGRVGIPTGLQFLLEVGSFSLLTALIAAMSEAEMASHQIVLHVIHFSFLPAYALAEAGSVLAGQAVGAERDELVGAVAKRAMAVAGAYTGLCTVLFALGAPAIVSLFSSDPELTSCAVRLLYVAAVFQVADAANMVGRGILRGTGDVRFPAVVGVVTAWVCTPPLTWLFGYQLGLGAQGGWIGLCVEIFVGASIFWRRLQSGGWRAAAARTRAEVKRTGIS
jgi:MATE family multidrug resistance protein